MRANFGLDDNFIFSFDNGSHFPNPLFETFLRKLLGVENRNSAILKKFVRSFRVIAVSLGMDKFLLYHKIEFKVLETIA